MLPPLLVQADIRALAGVCMGLWKIFGPLMTFKVTMMFDASPSYTLWRALEMTRTSAIIDRVAEVKIGDGIMAHKKTPYLLSPALFTLVKAVPAMRQLHTIHLSHIILPRMYLDTILSSPHLIHLIFDTVRLPKTGKIPPPKLRKLTLIASFPWEASQTLIDQLAASLEYFEVRECLFRALTPFKLPRFPCLRELRYHQYCIHDTVASESYIHSLFRVGSQVTHLHLHLAGYSDIRIAAALPKSLQHLSIEESMLRGQIWDTTTFRSLISLTILCFHERPTYQFPTRVICDHFPEITSLHLIIPWPLRNLALQVARSQPNVQALKLDINTRIGLNDDTRMVMWNCQVEIANCGFSNAMLPSALQSLRLDVVQTSCQFEQSIACCAQWIDNYVLPPVTGLGGPRLKVIDASFTGPESRLARERVLWKQWIKSPNDDWQMD